nr:MAG TPA_asm: hypothetical protein [Caudoviricetes sp.]
MFLVYGCKDMKIFSYYQIKHKDIFIFNTY